MTGEEAFEFAAAVAAVSGLAALLILSILAIVGTWRLFIHASEASAASGKAAAAIEEALQNLRAQVPPSLASAETTGQYAELRQRVEALVEQQRHLQEMARNLLDTAALEGTPGRDVEELESAVARLEATVGQMAASLANLIQKME